MCDDDVAALVVDNGASESFKKNTSKMRINGLQFISPINNFNGPLKCPNTLNFVHMEICDEKKLLFEWTIKN